MHHVDPERIPFLAGLPRLTLARLLPEMELLQLDRGDQVPAQHPDRVSIIHSGKVDWIGTDLEEQVSLLTLVTGDVLLGSDRSVQEVYICATRVELATLPRKRLDELAKNHPHVSQAIQKQMMQRLENTRNELVRTRKLLGNYARELWGAIPEQDVAAATAVTEEPVAVFTRSQEESKVRSKAPAREWWRSQWFGPVLGAVLVGVPMLLFPSSPPPAYYLIAIFVWAGINWALASVPDHVVALAALLGCVVFGLSTLEVAFMGFSTGAWWLLIAVLGLVTVISRTGILYRLALAMLEFLPPTYGGQMLALVLTGLFMTPCLPNTNVRVSILGPLAAELADAVGFAPRSKGAVGLAMAAYVGASQTYFLFLNGATMGMLMWGILPAAVKQQVTWAFWALAALPMALVLIAGFLLILNLFFRPRTVKPVARSMISLQRKVLGPISRNEWYAIITLSILILAFVTEPLHGISSTWIVILVFLFAMGTGLLDRDSLKQIDWSLGLYMGAVISLTSVAGKLGMNELLANVLGPLFIRLNAGPVTFLVGVAVLTILLRLAVPPPVVTVVLTVALGPVGQAMGVSPFLVGLVVVAFCSSWLVPQQWSVYLNMHTVTGERCFTHRQVHPLAWANNGLLIAGLIASVPFWRLMGLLP